MHVMHGRGPISICANLDARFSSAPVGDGNPTICKLELGDHPVAVKQMLRAQDQHSEESMYITNSSEPC